MERKKRTIGVIGSIIFTFFLCTTRVQGQPIEKPEGYPKKPIDIVVPMGAGGGSDITTRVLADIVKKNFGITITVSNRPGASGQVGLNYVLGQPTDGHTVLALFNDFAIHEAANPTAYPFTKQFELVCRLNTAPGTLQVRYDDSRFKSFKDFLELAKKQPGELKMVASGIGSINHLAMFQLFHAAGINVTYIPSDSAGERKSFLLGKHTDLMYEFLGTTLPLLRSKDTRMLFILHTERIPEFPDVPTAKELGYSLTPLWRGLAVRKGTSLEIVNFLDKIFFQAIQTREFDEYNKKDVCFNIYLNHEEYTKQIRQEIQDLIPVVEKIGLKDKLK